VTRRPGCSNRRRPSSVYAAATLAEVQEYVSTLARRKRLPVDVLALALHPGVPVWSDDDDLREASAEWFTTARLLKGLGVSSVRDTRATRRRVT
jgi:hypothetical protein